MIVAEKGTCVITSLNTDCIGAPFTFDGGNSTAVDPWALLKAVGSAQIEKAQARSVSIAWKS